MLLGWILMSKVNRPREYWDYENLSVNWGSLAQIRRLCLRVSQSFSGAKMTTRSFAKWAEANTVRRLFEDLRSTNVNKNGS